MIASSEVLSSAGSLGLTVWLSWWCSLWSLPIHLGLYYGRYYYSGAESTSIWGS